MDKKTKLDIVFNSHEGKELILESTKLLGIVSGIAGTLVYIISKDEKFNKQMNDDIFKAVQTVDAMQEELIKLGEKVDKLLEQYEKQVKH